MAWYATDREDEWTTDRRDLLNWMLNQEQPAQYAAALLHLQQRQEDGSVYIVDMRVRKKLTQTAAPDFNLARIEKRVIEDALVEAGNNRKTTAKLLGIARGTLYRKLREHNLE